ncbi:hypothetical protein M758_UG290100 [Ceratodon purpureus]|nr:hypothetical protein M758_UG290100 [Ceratodon purpureus]
MHPSSASRASSCTPASHIRSAHSRTLHMTTHPLAIPTTTRRPPRLLPPSCNPLQSAPDLAELDQRLARFNLHRLALKLPTESDPLATFAIACSLPSAAPASVTLLAVAAAMSPRPMKLPQRNPWLVNPQN